MMEEHCFEVSPRSRRSLMEAADALRNALRIKQDYFPIERVVEIEMPKVWPDFSFEIKERDELGEEHGRTYPERGEIWLRSDVYEGVLQGKGRDRFTLAHELGHLLLHQQSGLARTWKPVKEVKIYENPEWQANSFAGSLLITMEAARRNVTPELIAQVCGVTIQAANAQLRALQKEGLVRG